MLPTITEKFYITTPENDRGLRDILQKARTPHTETLIEDETTYEKALTQSALDLCRCCS
jgi:hypothetical protein